ncbi:MAG TPA: phosphoribosylglycinamide formyltransferase [Desulfobacteraceae bacterium]|nr:phosphoribosylglycinamide formyltransferase [Deltaproteobacteria bacterium]RLB97528.1 MAG: phosphoribosylglycinamide formyltransferase [Deltaproteobacteria bacterium]HDI59471.1 phosphoribosylglycinamide formyltransferase [Desulfobacteraceae bacterium]
MSTKLRIGALISGGGTNLQAILDACAQGAIDGQVVFVGTDNPAAKGLERARRYGVPTFVVDYGRIISAFRTDPTSVKQPPDADLDDLARRQCLLPPGTDPAKIERFLRSRVAAEAALLEAMAAHGLDLLVLAGFMRNLTPYFIDRLNTDPAKPRIMNIHPALLPAFPGTDGYGDTYRYGAKVGGCTVHFIDYGEDSGPIIGQRAFEIRPGDTEEHIRQRGLEIEWQLYPACIQLYAEDRLRVVERTHHLPGGRVYRRAVVEISEKRLKD